MKKIPLLIIFAVIFLPACGARSPEFEVSDPRQPIKVNAGKEFVIVLESNPTTGYHWALGGDLDANVVMFVKNEYISTGAPNLRGGGGLDLWTFKAVNAGETHIALGYYPPSNDPVDPQQIATFIVIVQ